MKMKFWKRLPRIFSKAGMLRRPAADFLLQQTGSCPNNERIEIHVRRVGDREDLFIVTDGGELINYLFSQGVDLTQDRGARRILDGIAENRSIKITEHQLVKGANEEEIAGAVRVVLEAVKEASFSLWHKIRSKPEDSVH